METVGQIKIDFDVYSNSPMNLTIFDNSDWLYASTLPAYLKVTIPGSSKSINYTFAKNKINNLNSHNLGISCLHGDCTEEVYIDLPDGIYTLCLQSGYADINKTKFYLKTDKFELEYAKVLIKFGYEYSKDNKLFIEVMSLISLYLKVAKAHAKTGDFSKAQRFFEEAKSKLKAFVECKNCV